MPEVIEREHAIGLFDEIICRGGGTVQLVRAAQPSLVVIGPPDLVDRVVVRYGGMRLVTTLRMGPNPISVIPAITDHLRVIVATDAISRVVAQGFVTVRLGEKEAEPLTAGTLRIVNAGSGRVSGYISTDSLTIRLRGMGGISLSGDTGSLDARLSGIGSLECGGVVCRTARVAVTGLGNANVMVLDELAASVTGAGSLSFRGSARLTRRAGQTGRINHLE